MQHCPNCGGGELKIIAAILERPVVEKILTHLGLDPQPPPKGRARAYQVKPWSRHQRRDPLHELHWRHHEVRRAVAPRCFELQLDLPGGIDLHALVGKRRPSDVAARLLQSLAVVCLHPHRGVQTEAVDVGEQPVGACLRVPTFGWLTPRRHQRQRAR
jgi:hypothetical protein